MKLNKPGLYVAAFGLVPLILGAPWYFAVAPAALVGLFLALNGLHSSAVGVKLLNAQATADLPGAPAATKKALKERLQEAGVLTPEALAAAHASNAAVPLLASDQAPSLADIGAGSVADTSTREFYDFPLVEEFASFASDLEQPMSESERHTTTSMAYRASEIELMEDLPSLFTPAVFEAMHANSD